MKDRIATLKKAIIHYGREQQLNIAIEEMSELTKEICKWKRGVDNRDAIIEEMADVYIMLWQMQFMFNVNPVLELDAKMQEKINRLNDRLNIEREVKQ